MALPIQLNPSIVTFPIYPLFIVLALVMLLFLCRVTGNKHQCSMRFVLLIHTPSGLLTSCMITLKLQILQLRVLWFDDIMHVFKERIHSRHTHKYEGAFMCGICCPPKDAGEVAGTACQLLCKFSIFLWCILIAS